MTNMRLPELNMYKDVNTFNSARILSKFFPKKKVLSIIQEGTRENSRSPMQWDDGPNAGFTTGRPWFFVNGNYREINVKAEEADPASLLNFYRRLLSFRATSTSTSMNAAISSSACWSSAPSPPSSCASTPPRGST